MAMTKKDYTLLAKALSNQRDNIEAKAKIETETLDETVETIAAHLSLMYDNFKKDVFMEEAGHGQDSNA